MSASPSQMQLADVLPDTAMGRMQVDLPTQIAQVDLRPFRVPRDNLVACAVVAQRLAKRDVHIQRQWHRFGRRTHAALLQRKNVFFFAKSLHETVRRRVGGVARPRHIEATQELGGDNSHGENFPCI